MSVVGREKWHDNFIFLEDGEMVKTPAQPPSSISCIWQVPGTQYIGPDTQESELHGCCLPDSQWVTPLPGETFLGLSQAAFPGNTLSSALLPVKVAEVCPVLRGLSTGSLGPCCAMLL